MIRSFVSLVTDASLTVLSERIHRGSLANARRALDERLAAEATAQAMLRDLESRTPVHRLSLTAISG